MNTKPTAGERRRREEIVHDERQFEAMLSDAFRIGSPAARSTRSRWPAVAAIAATLVLAAGAWLGLRTEPRSYDSSPLPTEVIAHIHHEPRALATSARTVPEDEFDGVLRRGGASLAAPVGQVTYAKLCPFRGRMVAHFVVQGERGPVTVLLLPDEHVTAALPIDEDGFKGTVVPLESGGSFAIVGQPDEDLEVIRARLAKAVRWSL
jgi:hypothetical protein